MSTGALLQIAGLLFAFFLIVAFVIAKILRGQSELAMKRLQKLNEDNLRREMELKRKLDEAEKSYKTKMEAAEQVGLKIRETSQKEAQDRQDQIIDRANTERDEIVVDAKEEAEAIKSAAHKQIEIDMLGKAAQLLKSTLSEEATITLHNHFVEQATKELSLLNLPKIEVPDNTVEVILSRSLTPEQKKQLTEILSSKIGRKINLLEKKDNNNIAGLYIKIGNFVVDGTFYNKLQRQMAKFKEEIKNER